MPEQAIRWPRRSLLNVWAESYFALTASSFQFGAALVLGMVYASVKSRTREQSHGIEVEPYAFFIAKSAVPIFPGDTPEELHARIQVAEHELYPSIIRKFATKA